MYGKKLKSGLLSVPDNVSFGISLDIDGDAQCEIIDYEKTNIKSNYQNIKSELSRLM